MKPNYRIPAEDRLRARLARRAESDRLERRGLIRITIAPRDPTAPVTDQHTIYRRTDR